MAHIRTIVYKPKRSKKSPDAYVRVPVDSAALKEGYGIEGDAKGGSPKRQLNIMSASTVEQLGSEGYKIAAGELGEQLVLDGIEVAELPSGTRLLLGDTACIEILKPRTGCERFEHIQSKNTHTGRLGMLARVITSGTIRVGDPVKVLETVS